MQTENPDISKHKAVEMVKSPQSGDGETEHPFHDIAQQTREAAETFSQQLKAETRQILSVRKDKLTEELESLSQVLRQASEKLHEDQKATAANVIESSVNGIDRVSDYLRNNDSREIIHQIEDFAKRRPAIVAGAAMVAGFFLAQLLTGGGKQITGTAGGAPGESKEYRSPDEEDHHGRH